MRKLTFIQLQEGNKEHYNLFESLMIPYNKEFDNHQGSVTPSDLILKVTSGMLKMQGVSDRHLELCYDDNNLIGFIYGKVDHEGHKGFIKPEYGYIMEFYVKSEFRRMGYGKAMFERLEGLFASHGTMRMYLTADSVTGKPFWKAMGFIDTGELSPENKQAIYEKDVKVTAFNTITATLDNAINVCDFYTQNNEALHGKQLTVDEWKEILLKDDPDEKIFLIRKSVTPVAWLRINGLQNKDILWISMLVVSDKYHRQGYALQFAENFAKEEGFAKIGIHTTDDNISAQKLYKKFGYFITEYGDCTTGDGMARKGYTFEKAL